MPAKRRKQVGQKAIRLIAPKDERATIENNDIVGILLYGGGGMTALLLDLDDSFGFADWEEARATWEANRELLLSLTTEDPRQADQAILPGMRPWGWWAFEAELPRKTLEEAGNFCTHQWERWQYDWLEEHDQLKEGEEEAARRVCSKILTGWDYNLKVEDPQIRRQHRAARKPFELDVPYDRILEFPLP